MRKLLCFIGAIGLAGCSGNLGGPSGSTTSGGGGVLGRALVQSASDAPIALGARNVALESRLDTLGFLKAQTTALGLSGAVDDFMMVRSDVGFDGLNHVRVAQTHGGIAVFGGDLVVHSNNHVFLGVGGNVLAGLSGLDLAPALSAASAVTQAKSDYARLALTGIRSRSIARRRSCRSCQLKAAMRAWCGMSSSTPSCRPASSRR